MPDTTSPATAELPQSPAPARSPLTRIVVTETVYHQAGCCQPVTAESRFSRALSTDEQPYVRRLTVSDRWTRLDCGWLEFAGMLVLKNDGASVVELGAVDPFHALPVVFALVPPGESARFYPSDTKGLMLRSTPGACQVTIHLFPR